MTNAPVETTEFTETPSAELVPRRVDHNAAALDSSLVMGVASVGAARWSVQILTWAASLYVVSLLSPEDYGVFGMALVFIGLLDLAKMFGIGSAVVVMRELSHDALKQANTLSVLIGASCLLLAGALAAPISWFFGSAQVAWVVAVLSFRFVFSGLVVLPEALIQRELGFGYLARIHVAQAVCGTVATTGLAVAGYGYWALVVGNMAGSGLATALLLIRRPCGFAWPQFADIQRLLAFGSHVFVSRITWYAYSNSDFLVVGRIFGERMLGAYTLAWTLASLPVEKISLIVMQVAHPVFAACAADNRNTRRYLLALTEGISLLAVPLAFGIAVTAAEFIPLFGEKWRLAIVPLQLLAIYTPVRAVAPLLTVVLNARRQTQFEMVLGMIAVLVFPVGFLVGSHWGVQGVAIAWMIFHPIFVAVRLRRLSRAIDLRVREYFAAFGPGLMCGLPMLAAVIASRLTMPVDLNRYAALAVQVLVGALTYLAMVAVFHRKRAVHLYRIVQRGRHQNGAKQPAQPGLAAEPQ